MSQFISIFNIHLRLCTLFMLLIILIHNQQISANSIYRTSLYEPQVLISDDGDDQLNMISGKNNLFYDSLDDADDDDLSLFNSWSRKFHSGYPQRYPSIRLRHGTIRTLPYKKRTIPLELQRALYAHGIVGR